MSLRFTQTGVTEPLEGEDEDGRIGQDRGPLCVCGRHFVQEALCNECLEEDLATAFDHGELYGRNQVYRAVYQWAWYQDKNVAAMIMALLGPVFAECIHCGALSDGHPSCVVCSERGE